MLSAALQQKFFLKKQHILKGCFNEYNLKWGLKTNPLFCVLYISMTHLFYNIFFNVKISQEVLASQYGRAKDNNKTMLVKNS